MSTQLFKAKYNVEACVQAVRACLESGWTGDGGKSREFEKAFLAYLNVPTHGAVYLNSCTAALHLALHALDLPKGSKVATTPLTFVSTNAVILYEGHTPKFVDVNPVTGSISFAAARKACLDPEVKAIIWVHYSGYATVDFEQFMAWRNQERPELGVIEDCAHAAGGFYSSLTPTENAHRRRIGSRSDTLACFSFQAVKNLPTADSGMLVTADPKMEERARRLSWLGIDKSTYERTNDTAKSELYKWSYQLNELGWKYRGNDIFASIALVQLGELDRDNSYRRQIYRWYSQGLHGRGLVMLEQAFTSSTHLCVVLVANRDLAIAALKFAGYAPGVHYLPNHEFPVFAPYAPTPESIPGVRALQDHVLSLPNHMGVTEAMVEEICTVIAGSQK